MYFRMPLGPVYTSMTLGLEGSMVIMRSALSATSAGLSTICENQKNQEVRREQTGENKRVETV